MPLLQDFSLCQREDGLLIVPMKPPVAIGGWDIDFRLQKRFGEFTSGLIVKCVASGFNGASGITITNSGQGQFNVSINSADTSGFDFQNYAFAISRRNSGAVSVLTEGYMLLGPSMG